MSVIYYENNNIIKVNVNDLYIKKNKIEISLNNKKIYYLKEKFIDKIISINLYKDIYSSLKYIKKLDMLFNTEYYNYITSHKKGDLNDLKILFNIKYINTFNTNDCLIENIEIYNDLYFILFWYFKDIHPFKKVNDIKENNKLLNAIIELLSFKVEEITDIQQVSKIYNAYTYRKNKGFLLFNNIPPLESIIYNKNISFENELRNNKNIFIIQPHIKFEFVNYNFTFDEDISFEKIFEVEGMNVYIAQTNKKYVLPFAPIKFVKEKILKQEPPKQLNEDNKENNKIYEYGDDEYFDEFGSVEL